MTSYRVVWLLVLQTSSVAASAKESIWGPEDCLDLPFYCKCELKQGKKLMTCTNKSLNKTMAPVNAFYLPDGIQIANLSYNHFDALSDNAFFEQGSVLDQLLVLNLSRNEIQSVAQNAFKNIDNLTTLDLSHNRIDRLHPLTFQYMSKLTVLHLDHNMIQTLDSFTFKGLDSLKVLDLSHCCLSKIRRWTFFFSKYPKLLNLKNNSLTTFHSNYVKSPVHFHGDINLSNNYIACDCNLLPFYQDSINFDRKIDLTCRSPFNMRGLTLTTLAMDNFKDCTTNLTSSIVLNNTVEVIASTTTELACNTIPGTLFTNWTIVSKVDGQDVSYWPDRFKERRSVKWVNLTISNTHKSDEGEYKCSVFEGDDEPRLHSISTTTLVVKKEEPSPIKPKITPTKDDASVNTAPTDDNETPWLVSSLAAVLAVFFVLVIFIVVKKRLRGAKSLPEVNIEPPPEDIYPYEDVDAAWSQLCRRTLPLPPSHEYERVIKPPGPLTNQYRQHNIMHRFDDDMFDSESSASTVGTSSQIPEYTRVGRPSGPLTNQYRQHNMIHRFDDDMFDSESSASTVGTSSQIPEYTRVSRPPRPLTNQYRQNNMIHRFDDDMFDSESSASSV